MGEFTQQRTQQPLRTEASATSGRAWGALGAAALTVGVGGTVRRAARGQKQRTVVRASSGTYESGDEDDEDDWSVATETATGGAGGVVSKTSVLVLGSTGTLGRQVVRQFLNAGYAVKCVVRNRADRQFSFLLDWGATVIEGSLTRDETLPSALIGVHTVIDCATARPEESVFDVDWEGKKALIQSCEKMKIQRYVFVSIQDCDKHTNVPLMQVKTLTEKFLQKSKLRYTTLRISGFMQPLISQYAVNVLDEQPVWGDDGGNNGIAYIDSNDCARMIASAALKERTIGKTLTITGPKTYTTSEVIKLCEKLSGREADVNTVSSTQIQLTLAAASCFDWSIDIAERLKFIEVNTGGSSELTPASTYDLLGMETNAVRSLDDYIGEYYRRVFKMLTDGKYEPEDGEVEKEKAEEERKMQMAINLGKDSLPSGFPEEREVTLAYQREMADRLQLCFEDRVLDRLESDVVKWAGWVPIAQDVNGRAAMLGFFLGIFTEWATGVSVPAQIDQLIDIFSARQ